MKIGELSRLTGVPKDSIRYYVENGLLFPNQRGKQTEYSEREKEDLIYIKCLRTARFSIKEIRFLQSLRRTSNMLEPDVLKEYSDMIRQKQQALKQEIRELTQAGELLKQESANLQSFRQASVQKLGVPLAALEFIICPACGRQMEIENAKIIKSGILSGELSCCCGHKIPIENGILITKNRYSGGEDRPDYRHGGIVQNVGDNFYNCFQKCSDYIMDQMKCGCLNGKIIMEAHVNGYFFLYNHFRELPTDCLYIVIDKFEETLQTYKKLLEQLNLPLNILFIADNSTGYPLRNQCVDLLISFFGDNEYLLYHNGFYIQAAGNYMKDDSLILGATMSLSRKSRTRMRLSEKYPESSPVTHNLTELKNAYEAENYSFTSEKVGYMVKTCKEYAYECHQDGEPLSMYYFRAKKTGAG